MTILQAIILGLVQGLGEFLPISSSAHLVLVPWFFGWTFPGLYLRFFFAPGNFVCGGDLLLERLVATYYQGTSLMSAASKGRLFWYLVAASVPGGIGFVRRNRGISVREKSRNHFYFGYSGLCYSPSS